MAFVCNCNKRCAESAMSGLFPLNLVAAEITVIEVIAAINDRNDRRILHRAGGFHSHGCRRHHLRGDARRDGYSWR